MSFALGNCSRQTENIPPVSTNSRRIHSSDRLHHWPFHIWRRSRRKTAWWIRSQIRCGSQSRNNPRTATSAILRAKWVALASRAPTAAPDVLTVKDCPPEPPPLALTSPSRAMETVSCSATSSNGCSGECEGNETNKYKESTNGGRYQTNLDRKEARNPKMATPRLAVQPILQALSWHGRHQRHWTLYGQTGLKGYQMGDKAIFFTGAP